MIKLLALLLLVKKVAEDYFGAQCALRNLTRKRKRTDKNKEYEKIQKPTFLECSENFTAARAQFIRNLATRTNGFGFLMQKI